VKPRITLFIMTLTLILYASITMKIKPPLNFLRGLRSNPDFGVGPSAVILCIQAFTTTRAICFALALAHFVSVHIINFILETRLRYCQCCRNFKQTVLNRRFGIPMFMVTSIVSGTKTFATKEVVKKNIFILSLIL